MNRSNLLSSPMIVYLLDMKNDLFHPYEKDEELFDSMIP